MRSQSTKTIGLFLLTFFVSTSVAGAESKVECLARIANLDLKIKTRYQEAMQSMIAKDKPEFRELAQLNRDLQLALAQARNKKLKFLLKQDLKRVETTEGLHQFRNFDWSKQDDRKFSAESPDNKKLLNKISKIKKQNQSHPDWPRLREYLMATLPKSKELQNIMIKLQSDQEEVEGKLKNCL